MRIRRYLFAFSFILTTYILYFVHDARYCDFKEQSKLVQMPSGKTIPYYVGSDNVKTYKELSGGEVCQYDREGIMKCPDVRFKGESMNRQSLLIIARLHAVWDAICKKHDIPYFVFAGSLLGAQRNGRMIPWDFDSDIGIMMDDFMTLLKYIRKDLPADVYFEDGIDNPSFKKFCEARLRDSSSCYGHCLRSGCQRHDGIQIDIFAFRRVKNNPEKIENFYYKKQLNYNDIYPTSTILLEGLSLSSPKNINALNTEMYGPDHLRLPNKNRHQCQKNGYTAIPWYNCEQIKAMPQKKQTELLSSSMGHRSLYYWFFG